MLQNTNFSNLSILISIKYMERWGFNGVELKKNTHGDEIKQQRLRGIAFRPLGHPSRSQK